MTKKFILTIVFYTTLNFVFSQNNKDNCKVLLQEISDSYVGKCKNGLAHGKGTAKGIDIYVGKFKKGFPHGKGKYTWKNGDYYNGRWKVGKKEGTGTMYTVQNKKEVLGIWKADKFVKVLPKPKYKIIRKEGIAGVSFIKKSDSEFNKVELVFVSNGNTSRSAGYLNISSSTGSISQTSFFSGVENVVYPIECNIDFKAPNKTNTLLLNYILKFKIFEEGSWEVKIRY